jgi:acyl-CoA synthetase (AMP-forming)/AMP-acid ligase II
LGLNICFFDEKYNPSSIIDFIDKYSITVLCGTPTSFNHLALYYKRLNKKSTIRVIAISGECLSSATAWKIREIFENAEIYNVYGLTEAAPRVSYLPPERFDNYPESVGVPIDVARVRIVNNFVDRNDVKNYEIGYIIVQSLSIMKGYYRNRELSNAVVYEKWLNTGDLGYFDENGFLYIKSRADDMIIKAGMNIYPKEIENALKQLEYIDDLIAYGISSATGQTIAIDVVLSRGNKEIDEKDLLNTFSGILPAYQMPTCLNIVKKLEKNASGKTIRPKVKTRD